MIRRLDVGDEGVVVGEWVCDMRAGLGVNGALSAWWLGVQRPLLMLLLGKLLYSLELSPALSP